MSHKIYFVDCSLFDKHDTERFTVWTGLLKLRNGGLVLG